MSTTTPLPSPNVVYNYKYDMRKCSKEFSNNLDYNFANFYMVLHK